MGLDLTSSWEPVAILISTHHTVKYNLLSDIVQITFCVPQLPSQIANNLTVTSHLLYPEHLYSD